MEITKIVTTQQVVIIPDFEQEIIKLVQKMYSDKSEWISGDRYTIAGKKFKLTIYRDRT